MIRLLKFEQHVFWHFIRYHTTFWTKFTHNWNFKIYTKNLRFFGRKSLFTWNFKTENWRFFGLLRISVQFSYNITWMLWTVYGHCLDYFLLIGMICDSISMRRILTKIHLLEPFLKKVICIVKVAWRVSWSPEFDARFPSSWSDQLFLAWVLNVRVAHLPLKDQKLNKVLSSFHEWAWEVC